MSLFHLREFHKGKEPRLKALTPCPILLDQNVFISTANCTGAWASVSLVSTEDLVRLSTSVFHLQLGGDASGGFLS